MGSMRNWMLGAAMVAGLAAAVPAAQAAEFGFRVRGPVAYVPPCPGPGYVWTAGYMANGYWVPGYWNFGGGVRIGGPVVRYGNGRGFDYREHRDDHRFDGAHERFRR
jgi:hypothetical protein